MLCIIQGGYGIGDKGLVEIFKSCLSGTFSVHAEIQVEGGSKSSGGEAPLNAALYVYIRTYVRRYEHTYSTYSTYAYGNALAYIQYK